MPLAEPALVHGSQSLMIDYFHRDAVPPSHFVG
jgi:hypothetical protein